MSRPLHTNHSKYLKYKNRYLTLMNRYGGSETNPSTPRHHPYSSNQGDGLLAPDKANRREQLKTRLADFQRTPLNPDQTSQLKTLSLGKLTNYIDALTTDWDEVEREADANNQDFNNPASDHGFEEMCELYGEDYMSELTRQLHEGKPVDLDLEYIQIKPEVLYTYVGYDDERHRIYYPKLP